MNLDIVNRVLQGSKRDCARLISIVENESKDYEKYLKEIYKHTGGAYVIGITGPPGAGKSTFTDKLVKLIRKDNKKVGVIAIDPTSPFTKGAILMKFITVKSYEELSNKAADIIASQIIMKPNCVLGLATGSTPEGLYAGLVK